MRSIAIRRFGDSLGVDWRRVDLAELRRGMRVEQEHNRGRLDVVRSATDIMKIALAHLREDPAYYRKLAKMERTAPERKTRVLKGVQPRPRVGDVHEFHGKQFVVTGNPSEGLASLSRLDGKVHVRVSHRFLGSSTRRATKVEMTSARPSEKRWSHPGLPGVRFTGPLQRDALQRERDVKSSERAAPRWNERARARAGLFAPEDVGEKADWTPESVRAMNARREQQMEAQRHATADRAALSRAAVRGATDRRSFRALQKQSHVLPSDPAYHADYWAGHERRLGLRKCVRERIVLLKAWQQGALDLFPSTTGSRADSSGAAPRRPKTRLRQPALFEMPKEQHDSFSAEWHSHLSDHARAMTVASRVGRSPKGGEFALTRMGIRHANREMAGRHGISMTADERSGLAVLRGVRPPPVSKAVSVVG